MHTIFNCGCFGFLVGFALNQAINLSMSYILRLGYYAPCLTLFIEIFGGELHAAAAQTLSAALLCAGLSISIRIMQGKGRIENDKPNCS